ncbi:MAG: trigger factor [Endozoicomonas sp. (ex Botrylloides leachii)]|nr:trigger factor [Endozoicomonas sp. (ex Botrylloides leachii)]
MQVELEVTSGLKRRLTITIPSDQIEEGINKRLQDLSRRIRLDGFRPGKAPMKVLKRRYGEGARQEVLDKMIQSSFVEAVGQENLNPAGVPSVEPVSKGQNEDFQFIASFEVYPEIELGNFAAISVERPVADVNEADVDEMINTLKQQSRTFEEINRGAEQGDQVTLDYQGTLDGEPFDGGSAENAELELGSGRMIPGFDDGLVGMMAGEEKVLKLTFPEDYHAKKLAGKTAEFSCKVSKVSTPVEPELDNAFFERFGVKDGNLEAFRSEVAKNMQRELRQAVKGKIKSQVMDGLLKLHDIEVPSVLISQEIDRMREQAVQSWNGENNDFDPKQLPAQLFETQAKKRIALGLLVNEVVKQRKVEVDDERVRVMVEEMAAAYQQPQDVIDWYYNNDQQLSQVKYIVLEEQVVDTILESANVSEKACSYQDAIKPEQKQQEEAADVVDDKSVEQET